MENCHEMEKAPEIFPETFFEAALTAAFADVPGLFHEAGEPEGTGEQKNLSGKNKADGSSGTEGRGEGKRKEAEQKVLPGEKIIIAGYAGESGAYAIAEKKKEILLQRFSPRYLDMGFLRQDLGGEAHLYGDGLHRGPGRKRRGFRSPVRAFEAF